jgi:metallophosphoesterase (TIGR00282 family)
MHILFVGDVFGHAGRHIVHEHLHHVVESHSIDLTIINVENAAGGFGCTPQIAEEFFDLGADVLTTGNHVWDKKELFPYLNEGATNPNSRNRRIIRPANYPDGTPGFGMVEGTTRSGVLFAVLNLQGRVFMPQIDDPFRKADELLKATKAKVIFIDFHAEATSEKVAMGWYLDGRVTAVIGTHTHVPTADSRILPHGTAYQTDVGMSGPYDSVIGVEKDLVLGRFLSGLPGKFEAAKDNPKMSAVVIDCDETTGKARCIQRLFLGE